jgi:hypothetical protein
MAADQVLTQSADNLTSASGTRSITLVPTYQ